MRIKKAKRKIISHLSSFNFHFQRGFTLIEILVVISVIGILSTIFIGVYSQAQKQARDGQRKFDLKSMQSNLENFYLQKNPQHYPYGDWTAMKAQLQAENLLKTEPKDPLSGGPQYYYIGRPSTGMTCTNAADATNCQNYLLCARMETTQDNNTLCSGVSGGYNYGIEAP